MLNPDWRNLTARYVRNQKQRDEKLKAVREALNRVSGTPGAGELMLFFRQLREILCK